MIELDAVGTWTETSLVLSNESLRRFRAEPEFHRAVLSAVRARATERGCSIDVYGEGEVCSWLELVEPDVSSSRAGAAGREPFR